MGGYELGRYDIEPDGGSVDLYWIHGLRAGVDCDADGLVQTNQAEAAIVALTSTPPRDHLVHAARSQTESHGPSLGQLFLVNRDCISDA